MALKGFITDWLNDLKSMLVRHGGWENLKEILYSREMIPRKIIWPNNEPRGLWKMKTNKEICQIIENRLIDWYSAC